MILFHHKTKSIQPRFAAWLFVALIIAFAVTAQYQVVVGLTGLGVTLLIAGVLLEINSPKIWADSLQWRKKNKKGPWYSRPNEFLYKIHIWVLWPLVIILGIAAIKAAYYLAK
jgi:hypothetical protein